MSEEICAQSVVLKTPVYAELYKKLSKVFIIIYKYLEIF